MGSTHFVAFKAKSYSQTHKWKENVVSQILYHLFVSMTYIALNKEVFDYKNFYFSYMLLFLALGNQGNAFFADYFHKLFKTSSVFVVLVFVSGVFKKIFLYGLVYFNEVRSTHVLISNTLSESVTMSHVILQQ